MKLLLLAPLLASVSVAQKPSSEKADDADFQVAVCADMVDLIYGEGTAALQQKSGADQPLCDTGADDEDGKVYCDISVALGYRTTCRESCASIGYECVATYNDVGDDECTVGTEQTCDTSLYSKICRCEGDQVISTKPPEAESSTAEGGKCSVNYGVRFLGGDDDQETEFEMQVDFPEDALPGVYTLSARVRADRKFDGEEQLLHSRWYDTDGNEIGTTTGGFPSERNKWETVKVEFDTGETKPDHVNFYLGYPVYAANGRIDARYPSIFDSKDNNYVTGADMACGVEPKEYQEDASRGDYEVRRFPSEPLCFVNQAGVDGMCGTTYKLSSSTGEYRNGEGFNAEQCADACISFGGSFTCNGFAVDGDGDCHLFEDANECVVDNGEESMDYYEMSLDCGELITCDLTIDNNLDAVYFNNIDITGSVTGFDDQDDGVTYNWNHKKTVSFRWDGITKGVLAIAGHEFDSATSCSHSGMLLGCSSDNLDSDWNFVRSDTTGAFVTGWSGSKDAEPDEDDSGREWFAIDYDDTEWPGVCESTSAFWCCAGDEGDITVGNGEVNLQAEKIWPCNCDVDAFFRVEVDGVIEKDILNSESSSSIVCDWEEEHPDKELQGCTVDKCFDFDTLKEAQRACEGYGINKCGGVTYNGKYETRLGDTLVDSPSGESSWLMADCSEREYDCKDGLEDVDGDEWQDSLGFTCEQYTAYHYCTVDGDEGNGWEEDWGGFADYADDNGLDATDVCCSCGGGEPTETMQPCFPITDAGECLSSYDSRADYASPCCVLDPRVNGNYCEPQSFIISQGFEEYATCKDLEGDDGTCSANCLGENTCDFWMAKSDITCARLETEMGCDCSGCLCPQTTQWRFIVNSVYGGGDQVQLTELSFIDADGNTMGLGENPVVKPGITNQDQNTWDTWLSDADPEFDQQLNCDPLPCYFQYAVDGEPAGFQMGYADSFDRLPNQMVVQYRDEDMEWVTVYSQAPQPPCGDSSDYTDAETVCEELSLETVGEEPLDQCPSTCMGQTCDYWVGAVDMDCTELEEEHGCSCWRCFCGTEELPTTTENFVTAGDGTDECSWWSCA